MPPPKRPGDRRTRSGPPPHAAKRPAGGRGAQPRPPAQGADPRPPKLQARKPGRKPEQAPRRDAEAARPPRAEADRRPRPPVRDSAQRPSRPGTQPRPPRPEAGNRRPRPETPERREAPARTGKQTRPKSRDAERQRAPRRSDEERWSAQDQAPAGGKAAEPDRLVIRARELAHAIALGELIEKDGRPADAVIAFYVRTHAELEGASRGAVLALTGAILRRRSLYDRWIAQSKIGLEPDPRLRVIAHLVLFEGRESAAIRRVFTGRSGAPAPLGGREAAMIEALAGKAPLDEHIPAAIRHGVPEWIEPRLRATFGDRFVIEMSALAENAPLDLRANLLKGDRDAARAALAKEGVKALPTPLSTIGLRVDHGIDLGRCAALRDGLIEPQDEGSQVAALLVDAQPGMFVVDYCAGAGGKTLALASVMQNKGRIVAADVLAGRLDRARVRFRRAGAHNIETRDSEDRKWFKRQRGRADRVLVDAPCTGIGSWRRIPDARWRLKPEDVDELVARQRQILDLACGLVADGGRLVYVTCSLLPAENEEQVAGFLGRHPEFTLLPVSDVWATAIGTPCPADGPTLTLTPARHGTGGFFIAVLERHKLDPLQDETT